MQAILRNRKIEYIKDLLKHADIRAIAGTPTGAGDTPLLWAAWRNREDVVKELLKLEGVLQTVHTVNYAGDTAILIARRFQFPHIVDLIEEAIRKKQRKDMLTALPRAVQKRNSAIKRKKLSRKVVNDEFYMKLYAPGGKKYKQALRSFTQHAQYQQSGKGRKVRKHNGVYQTGVKKGQLKKGYRYKRKGDKGKKKTKSGLRIIVKV